MAKYRFALEKMQVNSVLNNHPSGDWDVVSFGTEVGVNQFGPLKDYGSQAVHNGAVVDFTKYPGLRRNSQQADLGRWEIGPVDVADDDIVTVMYGIVNAQHALSHTGSVTLVQDIALGTWVLLVGIAGAAQGGVLGAVVAGIAAGIGGIAGGVLQDPGNCDGVVGGNKRAFTGRELRDATNNPQRTVTLSEQSGNQGGPNCGSSDIVMTYSVTSFPYYSRDCPDHC